MIERGRLTMIPTIEAKNAAQSLIDFIDESPSPWHAVASAEARLLAQGLQGSKRKRSGSWLREGVITWCAAALP